MTDRSAQTEWDDGSIAVSRTHHEQTIANAVIIHGLPADPTEHHGDWHYSEWVRQLVQVAMEAKSQRDGILPHLRRKCFSERGYNDWHRADAIVNGIADLLSDLCIEVRGLNATAADAAGEE